VAHELDSEADAHGSTFAADDAGAARHRIHERWERPVPWLGGEGPPPFLLATARRTVLAFDTGEPVLGRAADAEALVAAAVEALGRGSRPERCVVGSIPFDAAEPARLFCPERTERQETFPLELASRSASEREQRLIAGGDLESSSQDCSWFLEAVASAVAAIRRGELDKVVLARTREFALLRPLDACALLARLHALEPDCFTYALSAPRETETSRSFAGASPELLVSKKGHRIRSAPLAGSSPRSADPVEDRRRAAALLQSAKDQAEHRIVVECILDRLRPFVRKLSAARRPSLTSTRSLWHLVTEIEGELTDPKTPSLALALALHPTPAVCGAPTASAREFIRSHEPFDRGHFTGALGFMDAAGDGEWIVAIRCAEIAPRRLRLFAGAGVVADSVPALELNETEAKLRTVLEALGLHGGER
jgi:isochorismate synthase